MENMFAMDKNGNPGIPAAYAETHPGLLWGVLLWQSFDLDVFGQYFAGSPYGGKNFWPINDALSRARKKKGPVFKRMDTSWPMGTVVGIQTMWRIPSFVDSLRPLDAPIVPVMPAFYGGGIGKIDAEALKSYAPGFTTELYIFGVYYNRVRVTLTEDAFGEWRATYNIVVEEFGAPACAYYNENQPKGSSPYFIRLGVVLAEHEESLETPLFYRLYHTKKINAEIYPPHNTVLFPGTKVRILAEPRADRVLTEFTVQSEDKLSEATRAYPDLSAKGITAPYGYDDPTKAKYTYGPVNSDVYVTAVAEGVEIEEEIQAGIEQTIQMTTTDCLVEAGSWSTTGTSLPDEVEYSIDADGLITVFVPENVYDGNPGGRYYIDVQFEGYSQIKTLRVWVTVSSVAAYGTVWTAAGTLPEKPISIFEDSSKTVYITSGTNIYTTDDFVTFDVVPLTGTRTDVFGNVAEGPGGRLLLAETNQGFWIKEPSDAGFTKQAWAAPTSYWGSHSIWLSAHPDSDVFLHGGTNWLGTQQRLVARDASTGAILHTHDDGGIYSGHAHPGVLLPDGSWLITVPGGKYKVFRYTRAGGFVELISGTGWGSENLLYREANGRVVFIGNESDTQWFSRYTTDGGATWSDKTLLTVSLNSQVISAQPLKKNYLVVGSSTGPISRSTDTLATATLVATGLGGYVGWIIKRSTGTLLATVFRTGGTNIYKSEA